MTIRFDGNLAAARAYLAGLPYIAARWQYGYRGNVTLWIVLHAMVSPERSDMAEALGRYFATTDRQASTQYGVDNDSTVRYAPDDQIVAGAVGANHKGIHIEQAGMADENDWYDAYSTQMVREQTAPLVAALCLVYDLPIERVDVAGLRAGKRGITDHEALWRVFGGDVRSDPGDDYPWDLLLAEARLCAFGSSTPEPEDWLDMATPDEVREIVRDEVRAVIESELSNQDARINATVVAPLTAVLDQLDPRRTPGVTPRPLRDLVEPLHSAAVDRGLVDPL